jgi:hypothetical protein
MVPNTQVDPKGHLGGYAHEFTYLKAGLPQVNTGTTNDHPGTGVLVNHFTWANGTYDSTSSLDAPGARSTQVLLEGPHHALYALKFLYQIKDCSIASTIHWFFATGQDHPRWAVTQDSTTAAANCLSADTRGPYGDIDFDGNKGTNTAGVAWGTNYKFTSLCGDGPLSLNCSWDNSQPNVVPHVKLWSLEADSTMGFVGTQTEQQTGAGGYDFYKEGGQTAPNGPMPDPTIQPFQSNGYSLSLDPTLTDPTSKRLAWGNNYGSLGQAQYPSFDQTQTLSGIKQSYSTHVVLGAHSADPVGGAVAEVENIQGAELVADQNVAVALSGPAGVGRAETQTYSPAGYNPVYGVWSLQAQGPGPLSWNLHAASGALTNPIFWLTGASGNSVQSLQRDGTALVPGVDFVASAYPADKALLISYLGVINSDEQPTFALTPGTVKPAPTPAPAVQSAQPAAPTAAASAPTAGSAAWPSVTPSLRNTVVAALTGAALTAWNA